MEQPQHSSGLNCKSALTQHKRSYTTSEVMQHSQRIVELLDGDLVMSFDLSIIDILALSRQRAGTAMLGRPSSAF
jgi:hypothetical protein